VFVVDDIIHAELHFPGVTQNNINTSDGSPGNYSIIGCATAAQGPDSFNNPTPGLWTEIDNGECGGSGICILGIWGKFLDFATSDVTT
jgi:hypothetical protein